MKAQGSFEFGPFRLDPSERLLLRDGQPVPLAPKAFELLVALVSRAGHLATREDLLREVWPGTFVEEANLSYTVSLIRKALMDDAEPYRYVETVPRAGYRFVERVTTVHDGDGIAALLGDPTQAPSRRLVGDELLEIADDATSPAAGSRPRSRASYQWSAAGLGIIGLVLGIAGGWGLRARNAKTPSGMVSRLTLPMPEGTQFAVVGKNLASSRDGSKLALVALRGNVPELYVRELKGSDWKRLPGTERASSPFFSPDGEWLAFFVPGQLKRIPVTGSAPQLVGKQEVESLAFTGAWGDDGTIVYGGARLWRVPASGGVPERVRVPGDDDGRRRAYLRPWFLPGAGALLLGRWTADQARVELLSLASSERRTLIEPGVDPFYTSSGHLVYGWENQIFAVPFDLQKQSIRGVPVPVIAGVRSTLFVPPPAFEFALSDNGTLVYASGRKRERRLVWLERTGQVSPLPLRPGDFRFPALSPSGDRVAVGIADGASRNIWIADLGRGTFARLTSSHDAVFSLWSPDGEYVLFTSSEAGPYNMFRRRADGSGGAERILPSERDQRATGWSPDGRVLLLQEIDPTSHADVWQLPQTGDRKARPLIKTPHRESFATFSPNGKWIAYQSDESGRLEVYAQAYPGPGDRKLVSIEGGGDPLWNPNGQELVYRSGDQLWSVPVLPGAGLRLGRARPLLRADLIGRLGPGHQYGFSPDGKRFLFLEDMAAEPPPMLHVVLNWFEELKRLVPVAR